MKKSIEDIDVTAKRVLVRTDLNVPLENGTVADDTHILAALPTIRYLAERGARVILCAHLGRPRGKVVEELRLAPVAGRLAQLLGRDVARVDECVGPKAEAAAAALGPGDALLLENVRFEPGERTNDPGLAARLARLADVYVNDAFGVAHRAHASTEGVAHHLPAVAGLQMQRELEVLGRVLISPKHPFVLIVGGAQIADKIGLVEQLMDNVDVLLVGGGMANTLLKAGGFEVGRSLVADFSLQIARNILDKAGETLVLPVDLVVAERLDARAARRTVKVDAVPPDWQIADLGPRTIKLFAERLADAGTVVWNGPLGVFELPPFAKATFATAQALARLDTVTIIGGGDSVAAVRRAGVADKMSHISAGGSAFLTFMQGKEMPGVAALLDAQPRPEPSSAPARHVRE